jgi:hypothetical protein
VEVHVANTALLKPTIRGFSAVSTSAIHVDPNAVYDDDLLYALLGVTSQTLKKARQGKELRFARKGQRVLYLGQWILDWLNADSAIAAGDEAGLKPVGAS